MIMFGVRGRGRSRDQGRGKARRGGEGNVSECALRVRATNKRGFVSCLMRLLLFSIAAAQTTHTRETSSYGTVRYSTLRTRESLVHALHYDFIGKRVSNVKRLLIRDRVGKKQTVFVSCGGRFGFIFFWRKTGGRGEKEEERGQTHVNTHDVNTTHTVTAYDARRITPSRPRVSFMYCTRERKKKKHHSLYLQYLRRCVRVLCCAR